MNKKNIACLSRQCDSNMSNTPNLRNLVAALVILSLLPTTGAMPTSEPSPTTAATTVDTTDGNSDSGVIELAFIGVALFILGCLLSCAAGEDARGRDVPSFFCQGVEVCSEALEACGLCAIDYAVGCFYLPLNSATYLLDLFGCLMDSICNTEVAPEETPEDIQEVGQVLDVVEV